MNTLKSKNTLELAMFESDLSISQAVDGTMLIQMAKNDEKETIKTLVFLISRMNDDYNSKQKMNQQQMFTMAIDLLDVFKYETIEDVMLMFKYARQGKIGGKLFKLDSNVVFNEWVPAYLEQKAVERENRHLKAKSDANKNYDNNKSKLTDMFKNWKKDKQNPKVVKKKTYYNNYPHFIKHLPKTCKQLTNEELVQQIKLAEYKQLTEAVCIYKNELNKRLNEKQ
jgi:hypothetical protein